jgi:chromosome partitioning protein
VSVPAIAFFNSSGGIGRTSLVYHLAWMFSDLNVRVLAADLAPQAGLTAMFLPEDLLIDVWGDETRLISTRITDELIRPILLPFDDNLVLLPGNVALLEGEDELATKWSLAMSGIEEGVTGMSALSRSIQTAAELTEAQIILMDLGCNLGAVTRAAMISANYIVFPLTTDLVTLQSLPHVGATLSRWRKGWINCQNERRAGHLTPSGLM